jgi:L-alanine-DL-glutamate epimerase-like enolase superfamily enzyme
LGGQGFAGEDGGLAQLAKRLQGLNRFQLLADARRRHKYVGACVARVVGVTAEAFAQQYGELMQARFQVDLAVVDGAADQLAVLMAAALGRAKRLVVFGDGACRAGGGGGLSRAG